MALPLAGRWAATLAAAFGLILFRGIAGAVELRPASPAPAQTTLSEDGSAVDPVSSTTASGEAGDPTIGEAAIEGGPIEGALPDQSEEPELAIEIDWPPEKPAESDPPRAGAPPARPGRALSFLPPRSAAELLRRVGILVGWLGDGDGAARHYRQALGYSPDDPRLHLALGDALFHGGERDAALTHWRAAANPPEPVADAAQAAALGRIASRALGEHEPAPAIEALERAVRLRPLDAELGALLRRARFEASPETEPEPREAVALLPRNDDGVRAAVSSAADLVLSGVAKLPAGLREPIRDLMARGARSAWLDLAIALVVSLALLLPLLRLMRGRGSLGVLLHYPSELRGSFTVRLTRRDEGERRKRRSGSTPAKPARATANCHPLVSRETFFRRTTTGRWFVAVEGVLQASGKNDVLSEHFECRSVQVRRNQATRIEFDFHPQECPIDVNVVWDRRPAKDAGVTVLGMPNALRFARSGQARLKLTPGEHTIVVGSGDRVAQRRIDVHSYEPEVITIDLAGSADVLFKGCPPAVQPYLQGDLADAAGALAREGLTNEAAGLLARLSLELDDDAQAAEHFEQAGRPLQAAELWAERGEWTRAAELFVEGKELDRAAESFEKAEEWVRAGGVHEARRDFVSAIRCYRHGGAVREWVSALERCGMHFEAAERALEHEDRRTAIRLLQQIPPEDPRYADACRHLAAALEHEGHADMAARKLQELVALPGATSDDRFHLSELLERAGELGPAIDVLEQLRQTEPTFPNVAARMESLRKQHSAVIATHSRPASGSITAPTAPNLADRRYEIIQEIGRGGMGVVYRAHDKRLNREVALKRMPPNLREHPKAVQFFLREAQAVASLNHRNIVTIHDVDQEEGVYFITMELLKGNPLNRLLKARGRIGARDVAKLGVQVATGLSCAHEQGIVHRDIKTANLFLTTDRTVKVMDFGLAKMLAEVRRSSTVIGGTPFYMSPEQAIGDHTDHRADLYALGVTLFELSTGSVPFAEGDVAYHHRHTAPADPRTRCAEVPAALAGLILHCLQKDPEARPASAQHVREALEGMLRG